MCICSRDGIQDHERERVLLGSAGYLYTGRFYEKTAMPGGIAGYVFEVAIGKDSARYEGNPEIRSFIIAIAVVIMHEEIEEF